MPHDLAYHDVGHPDPTGYDTTAPRGTAKHGTARHSTGTCDPGTHDPGTRNPGTHDPGTGHPTGPVTYSPCPDNPIGYDSNGYDPAAHSAAVPAPPLPVRVPVTGPDGRCYQPSRVRPYALTGGRTRFGHVLLVETIIATIDPPEDRRELVSGAHRERGLPEMRAIVELCRVVCSVAEISAILRIPLGVVRVLLSDLADQGRIQVHRTGHGDGTPDSALLERVLSGLRRL